MLTSYPAALAGVPRPAVTLPRSLTWLAALAYSAGLLTAALLSGSPKALAATALLVGLTAAFVVRPLWGVVGVLLVHQSADLWADGQFDSLAGLKLNLTTGITLMIVVVGGAYVVENWRSARRAPSLWPFIALTALAIVSLVNTPSVTLGVTDVMRLAQIGVLYALVYSLVRSRRDIELIVAALLISVLGVIGVAIEQTINAERSSLGVFQFDRATGGFPGPDALGIVLGVLLCFAIPFALGTRLVWRWLLVAWIAVAGVALVGSYTRTGWLTLIVGLLVIGVVRYRILLILIPVTLAVVVLAVPSTVQRFNDLNQDPAHQGHYGNTFSQRLSLWRTNLPKVNQSPVIGHGFASIGEQEGSLTHSDYVRTVVETGILGLLAFLALLASGVGGAIGAVRRTNRLSDDRVLLATAVGGLGVAVVYVLASADSNLLTKTVMNGAVWTLVALAHSTGRLAAD